MGGYCVIRFYKEDHPARVIRRGLTREEAVEHCQDPETSSSTCCEPENIAHTERWGDWFDGFDEEVGR